MRFAALSLGDDFLTLIDAAEHTFPLGPFLDGSPEEWQMVLSAIREPDLVESEFKLAVVYGRILVNRWTSVEEAPLLAKSLCDFVLWSFVSTSFDNPELVPMRLEDIDVVVFDKRDILFSALVSSRNPSALTNDDNGVSYFPLIEGHDPVTALLNRPAIFAVKRLVAHGTQVTRENWRQFVKMRALVRALEQFR